MARKTKEAPYMASGEIQRIKSLGNGTYAYVFDANGKTHHVKRNSEEMIRICHETDQIMSGKVTAQLVEMGWTDVLESLKALEA